MTAARRFSVVPSEDLGEAFGTATRASPRAAARLGHSAGILSRRLIPDRRPLSHGRRGIKLIINHAHVAYVLRVKQEIEA